MVASISPSRYKLTFNLLGNVYIADSSNNFIRKLTVSTGVVTTIAGTGSNGFSGDGGLATSAALNDPVGIAVDSSGILLLIYLTTALSADIILF